MTMRKISQNTSKLETETVLVLQGGGSLGAYECGVIKGLNKNGVNFDILAGSSIGAINTSIIASAQVKGKDDSWSILEDFWLSLSENMIFPDSFLNPNPVPDIV
jgi:NTE family protein